MARQSMILVASWHGRSVAGLFFRAGARSPIKGLLVMSACPACSSIGTLTCTRGIVVCKLYPNVRNAEGLSRGNAGFPLPHPNAPAFDGEERAGAGVVGY